MWFNGHIHKPRRKGSKTSAQRPQAQAILPPAQTTPLHALLIGINNYGQETDLPSLRGSIHDVQGIKSVLTTRWRVKDKNITMLLDEAATRRAIIREIDALSRGHPDDAVFIFYAGHGTLADGPNGYPARFENPDGKIQCLVPFDFCPAKGIHAIPGYTIHALLEKIAMKRTSNISIFTDCCYSGNSLRGDEEGITYRRAVLDDYRLTSQLDCDIWGRIGADEGGVPAYVIQKPYAHISACAARELAAEDRTGGRFTKALLKLFLDPGFSAKDMSYNQIIAKIEHIPGQNPQIDTENGQRLLFGGVVKTPAYNIYEVILDDDDLSEEWILKAGHADGVCEGAVFALYRDEGPLRRGDQPLAFMTVHNVFSINRSILKLQGSQVGSELPHNMVAIQVRSSDAELLKIYAPRIDPKLKSTFQSLLDGLGSIRTPRGTIFVQEAREADLSLVSDSTGTYFEHLHPQLTKHGLRRIEYRLPTDDIKALRDVLDGSSRFFFHLWRRHGATDLRQYVAVRFLEVVNKPGRLFMTPKTPEANLIRHDGTILLDCPRELPKGQRPASYGIEIRNLTRDVPWYVSAFYFNCSDLSVEPYYLGPRPNQFKTDPPLLPDGQLLIGYGAIGKKAYHYSIPDRQTVDVGFLKIFISSVPVDVSHIAQGSPFPGRGSFKNEDNTQEEYWDALIIPIVQRVPPSVATRL